MNRLAVVTLAALTALAPSLAAAETDDPTDKSPTTAVVIASSATAAGLALTVPAFLSAAGARDAGDLALGAAGLTLALVAPSAGHIYAGDYKHAALTTGLRVGGVLAIAGGLSMVSVDEDPTLRTEVGLTIAAAGAGLIAAMMVYDIYDAPKAARRMNERRQLTFTPTALPAKDGVAPAFAVAGTF